MASNYILIKNKVKGLNYEDGNKYINKMYNNKLLTINKLQKLDDLIFRLKFKN